MTILVVACTPIPIPTSATATPQSTRAPLTTPTPNYEGGAITIGALNADANEFIQAALYDSLLQIDPQNGSLAPALAESFQISDDALTVTFRLRANVKFHNGDPLTADDVVATINAFNAPDFRGAPAADFGTLSKASALDLQTVQLLFRDAYCPALTYIGALKIYPRAMIAASNFPRLTDAQLIGTGALKFIARDANQIVFTRNPEYWRGAPHVQDWTLKIFSDARALRAALAENQIDAAAIDARDLAAIKKIANTKIFATDTAEIAMLVFNADTPTLNDARVRQALTFALNKNILASDLNDQGRIVETSALGNFWASPQNFSVTAFDPNRAKQLLADAGWRDNGDGILRRANKTFSLDLWTEGDDPILEPFAFRVREQLAALGIKVELQLGDRAGWITRAFQHRFDLLLLTRQIPLDPDQHWYWQSDQASKSDGFNFGSFSNPRVDQLSKQLNRVSACGPPARAALFVEIQKQLQNDPPAVFLIAPQKYFAASERVLNVAPSPFSGDFWNLRDWRVKP
ncbi:MAG: hypothetical protein HY070_05485 [Chloroflexi bacterium]|nr:hypothetical protein [Chloroflexota bacterium]